MIGKNILSLVFCVSIFASGFAQKLATLEVELASPTIGLSVPLKIELDAVTFLPDSVLSLEEVRGNKKIPVAYQIENEGSRTLHWMIRPDKVGKRVFELVKVTKRSNADIVFVKAADGTLTFQSGNKNLLRYYYKTLYPPAGVDTAYKRSGFIHPLWSPRGQVLTRIQPKDHYHHYGIWNPWTHVLYEGDTVDFWNLGDKKGTVRFARFISAVNGPVFGEYQVLHEHVVFKKDKKEKIAMNEWQSVKVYQSPNEDYYLVDITSKMNCASGSPVLLLKYRYGGLGWRTTEQWNNKNSEVLTSEGKTRKYADGTTARWCIVQGAVDSDYAGIVMMSYPTNYNHPEPLRVWPENQYERGDMFANFSPTKNKDWLLEPGKTYTLKYRLLVFNGHFTKEKAESAWQSFAHPPVVTVHREISGTIHR
jgi:Methane oxygenase PmoA